MKFASALTLLVAAGGSVVTAQDKNCEADYIVTRCLKTENDKAGACASTDFDCLCAAYQAIATCYNNCPNDDRAPSARAQVTAYCRYASSTTASSAATPATTSSTDAASTGAHGAASSSANSNNAGIATNLNAPAPSTSTGFVAGSSATPKSAAGNKAREVVGGRGTGAVALVAGVAGALALL
ncbi:hypothetical protein IF1G_09093 [Cordyceps javanica]|uniref:GPI anchored serine-threonine rich protein n=1 Tax=Cordyceps javanica TaxID=43265 RepID=A0A545VR36_9HYPO|nr:hypothetical protein IF1G_09093 [Cordyceps javanica]TQW04193.1 CFEM domain-containing protein [Cordyceps javanica]